MYVVRLVVENEQTGIWGPFATEADGFAFVEDFQAMGARMDAAKGLAPTVADHMYHVEEITNPFEAFAYEEMFCA